MAIFFIILIVIFVLVITITQNKKETPTNNIGIKNKSFSFKITTKYPDGKIEEFHQTTPLFKPEKPPIRFNSNLHIKKLLDISSQFPQRKDGSTDSYLLEKYLLDNYPILLYSEFFKSDDIVKVSRKLKKLYTVQDLREFIGDRIDKEFRSIKGNGRDYVFYTDMLFSNIKQCIWAYRDSKCINLKIKYSQSTYDKSAPSKFSNLNDKNIPVNKIIDLLGEILNIDVTNLSYDESLAEYRRLKPLLDEYSDLEDNSYLHLPPYCYNSRYDLRLENSYD